MTGVSGSSTNSASSYPLRGTGTQERREYALPLLRQTRIRRHTYTNQADTVAADIAGTLGTALPMAAMFTRNRLIGWTAVLFAIQSWLNEVPSQVAAGKQPAFFSVGMSIMSLVIVSGPERRERNAMG